MGLQLRHIYRALNLTDNYRLSLPALTPPRVWAFGRLDDVHTISEPTESDKMALHRKYESNTADIVIIDFVLEVASLYTAI